MIKISPSILSADFSNLEREIKALEEAGADMIHIDVMDGCFVPSLTFGAPIIKAIRKHTKLPFDVHLMIEQPDRYIKQFKSVGADVFTVHYEACKHLHRTLQTIKAEDMQRGVALNPHTPVSLLEPVLYDIDLVCLMSVNPGFGGQSFIEHTYDKVSELRQMIDAKGLSTKIEIDGGVTMSNARKLIDAGADVLVAGSFVFNSAAPMATIKELKNA